MNEKLIQLKEDGLINDQEYEPVREEDVVLKIKFRTYKKCSKQLVLGLLLFGSGLIVSNASNLKYLFIAIGFFFP
jgi:hypothetical protein